MIGFKEEMNRSVIPPRPSPGRVESDNQINPNELIVSMNDRNGNHVGGIPLLELVAIIIRHAQHPEEALADIEATMGRKG